MQIRKIQLANFKNYEELTLSFSEGVNGIVGENGSGKTNLLDAIHYLCLSKSAFNVVDSQNIRHEANFFLVQGIFEKEEKEYEIHCSLQEGKTKTLKVDKKAYPKISEHIGRFPCVLMTPYDTDLIREGSEVRRKFFDNTLSQIDQIYLADLLKYNKLLEQRNSLLKQFAERNYVDKTLIETYNAQLLPLAKNIFEKRTAFVHSFIPILENYYFFICNEREKITLSYLSDLQTENFESLFENQLSKDILLHRTTKGIHKDDYNFQISGYSINKFGSQGQQKSYVIALKLAQFELLSQLKNVKPILLLDDIFDRLDDMRIKKLMELMSSGKFGQVFITDARPERTAGLFKEINQEISLFDIRPPR
ncbi:MAG: DNA replication and repair protein RecF [Cytophagales bacterium]|nr:MAG: DNA replication and repair protein RecF [Cytophagales bacterium]